MSGGTALYCNECGNNGKRREDGSGAFKMPVIVYSMFTASENYSESARILGHEPISNPIQSMYDGDSKLTCRDCGSQDVEIVVEVDRQKEKQAVAAIEQMGDSGLAIDMGEDSHNDFADEQIIHGSINGHADIEPGDQFLIK